MLQKQIRTKIKTFGSCFPLPPHLGRLAARLSLIKAGNAELLFCFYLSPIFYFISQDLLSSSPEPKLKGGPAGLEEVGD